MERIHSSFIFLASVLVLFALNGCQNDQATHQSVSAAPTIKWSVSLTTSGGIKGQSQTVSIDHQGVAQFTDHLNKTQKSHPISPADLNNIANLVKNYSSAATTKGTKSTSCRDCFNYTINTRYDGNIKREHMSDINQNENLQPLLGALKKISSELAQQNK